MCDFGSASIDESDITPYLVSRFYRAPEIIIGNKWNAKIDVWAAGCTLFELFTGKILFPGKTNNQMLKLMMDCLGKFPNKIIRNGQFFEKHFDNGFNFLYHYESNGETIVKAVAVPAGKSNLKSIVLAGVAEEVVALVTMFADFLERTLMLNPEKRIKPTEALQHPFLTI